MARGKRYKLQTLAALPAILLAIDLALIGGCASPTQTSGPQVAESARLAS